MSELRHVEDIIFAVASLRKKGISDQDIYIFDDYSKRDILYSQLSIESRLYNLKDFKAILESIDMEFAVVLVTGHGSCNGIPINEDEFISPDLLTKSLRQIKNLKRAVVILGQCYAGVFNYIETYNEPKLVVMGATNLHLSLSSQIKLQSPVKLNDGKILESWGANFFIYYLMEWILNPLDMDGDGRFTVTDAYKYSGYKSNQKLIDSKGQFSVTMDNWLFGGLQQCRALQSGAETERLKAMAIARQIEQNLQILHMQQEPWLLNANESRTIEICL